MQILIQFYTIVVFFCLLLLSSQKQIQIDRFLGSLLLLLGYSVFVGIAGEIGRENVPAAFVMSGFVAKTLFIPAAYLYLRNHFHGNRLTSKDFTHLLPCVILCAGCFLALLIYGNLNFLLYNSTRLRSTPGEVAVVSFQIFISSVTGFYLWIVLKMLKTIYMQFGKNISDSEINHVFSENENPEKKNGNHPLFFSDEKMGHIDSVVREFLTEKKNPS